MSFFTATDASEKLFALSDDEEDNLSELQSTDDDSDGEEIDFETSAATSSNVIDEDVADETEIEIEPAAKRWRGMNREAIDSIDAALDATNYDMIDLQSRPSKALSAFLEKPVRPRQSH